MNLLISTIILGSSFSLWALTPERPTAPPLAIDKVLTGGEEPRVFFEKRASDAACQEDLKTAKTEVRTIKDAMKAMSAAKAPATELDDKEADLAVARETLLTLMEKCGECATQEVETQELNFKTHKETWFISDGSCQIPSADPAKLKKAFELISDSLIHAKRYPRTKDGFENVLDFQIVENGTTFKPQEDLFPKSPANLTIWVRGPRALRLMFYYFMEATYATQPTPNGGSEFFLKFTAAEPKAKLTYPTVTDFTASGKPIPLISMLLKNVVGQWYVTSDGYIRYFTAAQLPNNLGASVFKKLGRGVLIDTLTEISARGEWE